LISDPTIRALALATFASGLPDPTAAHDQAKATANLIADELERRAILGILKWSTEKGDSVGRDAKRHAAAVDANFDRFIAARCALLDERLTAIDIKANGGLLPDVTLDKGVLKITRLRSRHRPRPRRLPSASAP